MCDTDEVKKRLDRIEKCVDENNRALRGHNGEPGIVAQVATMVVKVETLKTLLTNDMNHIKESIEQRDKYEHERLLSWSYVRDNALVPVIISLSTALVTAFLILKFGL